MSTTAVTSRRSGPKASVTIHCRPEVRIAGGLGPLLLLDQPTNFRQHAASKQQVGLNDHTAKIGPSRPLDRPRRVDGRRHGHKCPSRCAANCSRHFRVVAPGSHLFASGTATRSRGPLDRRASRLAARCARRRSASRRMWAIASTSELPRPTRINSVSSGDYRRGCPAKACRQRSSRQLDNRRVAAEAGAKIRSRRRGFLADRLGQGVGNVALGVAGGKQHQRHRPNARSLRSRPGGRRPSRSRVRPVRENSRSRASRVFGRRLSTKHRNSARPARIARAMTDDEHSVELACRSIRIALSGLDPPWFELSWSRSAGLEIGSDISGRRPQCFGQWPRYVDPRRRRVGAAAAPLVVYWTLSPAAIRRVPGVSPDCVDTQSLWQQDPCTPI